MSMGGNVTYKVWEQITCVTSLLLLRSSASSVLCWHVHPAQHRPCMRGPGIDSPARGCASMRVHAQFTRGGEHCTSVETFKVSVSNQSPVRFERLAREFPREGRRGSRRRARHTRSDEMVRVKNAPKEYYWALTKRLDCSSSPSSPGMFNDLLEEVVTSGSFDQDQCDDNLFYSLETPGDDGNLDYQCPWNYSKDDALKTVDYHMDDLPPLSLPNSTGGAYTDWDRSILSGLFKARGDEVTPEEQDDDATPEGQDDNEIRGGKGDATPEEQENDAIPGVQGNDATPGAQDDGTIPKLSDFGSEYEFQRARNIAKNNTVLQSLGLGQAKLPTFSKRPPVTCKRPSAKFKQSPLAPSRRRSIRRVAKTDSFSGDTSDDDAPEVLPEYGSVCSSRAISPENVTDAVEQLSIEELIDTLNFSSAQSTSERSAFQDYKLKGLKKLQSKGVTKTPGRKPKKLQKSQEGQGTQDPLPSMDLACMNLHDIERQLKFVDVSLSTDDVQTTTPGKQDKVTFLSWMQNRKVQAKPVIRDDKGDPYNYYIGVFDTPEIATVANTLYFSALKSDSVIQNIKNAANNDRDASVKLVATKVIKALRKAGPGGREV